jgi:hypothetical protein
MKVRRGRVIFLALVAPVATVLVRALRAGYRFSYLAFGTSCELKVAALLKDNHPHRMLVGASRNYSTHNFPAAEPHYEKAEVEIANSLLRGNGGMS